MMLWEMMMSKQHMAIKVINNSRYNEFPDIIATIRLAMWFAKADYRSVDEAMRYTARACLQRAENEHLRRTLLEMSKTPTPNQHLADLVICQLKMRDQLAHELKGKTKNQTTQKTE